MYHIKINIFFFRDNIEFYMLWHVFYKIQNEISILILHISGNGFLFYAFMLCKKTTYYLEILYFKAG